MKTEALRKKWAELYGDRFFTYDEFACKCERCQAVRLNDAETGRWFMTPEFQSFMRKLQCLRVELGFPFSVNSGYRCEYHSEEASKKGGPGPHNTAAADIKCSFERSYKLIAAATREGMGVGPVQHGPTGNRFVHVDNQGERFWTYNSG